MIKRHSQVAPTIVLEAGVRDHTHFWAVVALSRHGRALVWSLCPCIRAWEPRWGLHLMASPEEGGGFNM
jgi:hypothetical protein